MGETAPPQAPAGGHGIGVGLLGGGTVAPRLHSAIVERLRARIAVCRQHHLNCEGRYERTRAESSDRERENTLQLLTLVQHGQGTRKSSKHNKSAPPDYRQHQQQQQPLLRDNAADTSGDQHHQPPNGLAQRNPALIALQGSLKRKLVVNVPSSNKRPNGISENSFLDFKKIGPIGQSMYHDVNGVTQSHNGMLQMDHGLHKKSAASNCEANDLFNSTLKNIKNEPGESLPCSKHLDHRLSHENSYRYGNDEQMMDPDLQELFNEFSYISVPPMSDLELQNMINITIKQDEPFNIDLGQQNQGNSMLSTSLDKVVIKTEYSPCLNPTRVGSPQMRPSSTGPSYSMSGSPLTSSPSVTVPSIQGSSCQSHLNNWQELSHAQQLKQIAANRQQNMIQQQQTNSTPNWPRVPSMEQSSRQYGLDKVQSPFRQQQLSPHGSSMSVNQQKPTNNYLYKNNLSAQSTQEPNKNSINASHLPEEQHHGLTKPLFHFSPESSGQQSPLLPQNKPLLPIPGHSQQQNSTQNSQQHDKAQQANPLTANQAPPMSGGFHQKTMIPKMQQNHQLPGMQYSNVHQLQEKCNSQDPLSRRLARPPPDYKDQRRNNAPMQQPNQFNSGVSPDPQVTNTTSAHLSPQNPHPAANHTSRMTSPDLYGNGPCQKQNMYGNMNPVPPQSSPSQMVSSQSGNALSSQASLTSGNKFGTPPAVNPSPFRPGPTHANGAAGQRPPEAINKTSTSQKWMSPEAAKRPDVATFTNSNQFANQPMPGVMAHQQYPQRGLSLSNQGLQMSPLNQMSPNSGGQPMEPLRGFNHRQSPQRSQMLTNLGQAGGTSSTPASPFNATPPIPSRAFTRSDSFNDLVTFDFISQNGGLGSSLSSDSDFIDALLKTGHNNDDWMKDINLDEIFKGHT